LGWFDLFTFNIPRWVYIQYLTLYSNWLSWWNNTVEIKNLKKPEGLLKKNSNQEIIESEASNLEETNKYINKKNILIALGIITLIGVGIWYWYYSGDAGSGGGNPTNKNPIEIFNNQTGNVVDPATLTDAERLELVDRANRLRDAGRITHPEHNDLVNTILSPAPSYEANTSSTIINPEYDQFFSETNTVSQNTNQPSPLLSPVTNDNSTASGSGNNVSSTLVEVITETPREVPEVIVTPASPVEASSSSIERPLSPTGSTDSSETIRPFSYRQQNEPTRFAIPRRPFDPVYRNNNN